MLDICSGMSNPGKVGNMAFKCSTFVRFALSLTNEEDKVV